MYPNMRPISAAIRSTGLTPHEPAEPSRKTPTETVRFITISRQAGAGGHTLANLLAERLNQRPRAPRWRSYDRELVERIAAEHHIDSRTVASIEDVSHHWLKDVLTGLRATRPQPDELTVYRAVASTIARIAEQGHAIIVGRGGVFITRNIAGGIHILLVAPFDARAQHMAKLHNISDEEARKLVRAIDQNRQDFYRRYWPNRPTASESFTITLNAAQLADEQMLQIILPLIPREHQPTPWTSDRPLGQLL